MSKQLLRSGTCVGAMIRDAVHAETKNDFKHKMGMAQKEINDQRDIILARTIEKTDYLTAEQLESINSYAVKIIKLTKSTKTNINR